MRTQRFAATCPRINNNFNKTTKFLHLETPEGISFSELFSKVQPLTIFFTFQCQLPNTTFGFLFFRVPNIRAFFVG